MQQLKKGAPLFNFSWNSDSTPVLHDCHNWSVFAEVKFFRYREGPKGMGIFLKFAQPRLQIAGGRCLCHFVDDYRGFVEILIEIECSDYDIRIGVACYFCLNFKTMHNCVHMIVFS